VGFCGCENNNLASLKGEEILDQLSDFVVRCYLFSTADKVT
jgi:hypothetical protein